MNGRVLHTAQTRWAKGWHMFQAWWRCYGNLEQRHRTLRQFSRKQCFIVPAQTQWTRVQRLSPEIKGGSPYIPLQAGYRSKNLSWIHIRLHVTLFAPSPPPPPAVLVTFFMFQFFKFSLSALPSLPPASLSEHSLSVSLLALLPATLLPLWCSDPPRVKEHHPDLGVCISVASLHGWLFFFL
jgi:hypothetical protein